VNLILILPLKLTFATTPETLSLLIDTDKRASRQLRSSRASRIDWIAQLLIGIPFVKSEPIAPEEMLEALGHTSDSATSILKDVKNQMERNGGN
jgi:hypothetical protein